MANEMLTSGGIQVGWGEQWDTLANAINSYYGGSVDGVQYQQVVQMLNSGNYTMEEMESILQHIPQFNRTYNAAGQLTNVSYQTTTNAATSAAGSVAQQVDSNVANATKTQFSTVQNITKDAQTGKVTISDNIVKYKTGQLAPTTMKGIPISALQGVMATSAGITVGKSFAQLAYDKGWNYLEYAGVSMDAINPATWSTITQDNDSAAAKAFNFILGIDENNNPQPYMDETTFAYMIAYMGATGVFDTSADQTWDGDEPTGFHVVTPLYRTNRTFQPIINGIAYTAYYLGEFSNIISDIQYDYLDGFVITSGDSDIYVTSFNNDNNSIQSVISSKSPFSGRFCRKVVSQAGTDAFIGGGTWTSTAATFAGQTVYYFGFNQQNVGMNGVTSLGSNDLNFTYQDETAWLLQYGDFAGGGGGIEGITDQTGATVFNGSGISDWSDIAAVLAALKLQYPNLWDERAEVSPDGDTTITYIPVGFPTGGTGQQPTTDGATQSELAPDITGDGDNSTDELIKTLIDAITHPQDATGMESDTNTPTKPVDPNGGDTGTGSTPVIIPPIGTASALWKIYNPSQGQLDTFGAWLWSSNFVDQLLKLFNDPMQAIIGLHKVYVTPPTSGSGAIKVGYLVSDASANYVSAQYTEIDCGSVDMLEDFNNVFDYDPFTKITVFLPFIGFRSLNVSDVMRGKIGIKYTVDVLTGACLAKISVTRDANTNVLYTFAGNCAVQYPISSGSYVGIITGLLGIAGGIAGTIASGGALAPMLMGAGASIGAMHANVEHSGNISANAGAMGAKKPYIIIERPQTKIPLLGVDIEGKPQNKTVVLGSLTGHVRVKAAEYNGFSCTAGELTKIKQLLSSGIII